MKSFFSEIYSKVDDMIKMMILAWKYEKNVKFQKKNFWFSARIFAQNGTKPHETTRNHHETITKPLRNHYETTRKWNEPVQKSYETDRVRFAGI